MIDHSIVLPPGVVRALLELTGGATVTIEAVESGGPFHWYARQPGAVCEAGTAPTMTAAAHAGAAAVERRRAAA